MDVSRFLFFIGKIQEEIFSSFLFFCLLFFNTPYLIYLIITGSKAHCFAALGRSVFFAWLICLILCLLKKYMRCYMLAFIIVSFVALNTFFLDCFSLYQYGYPFNSGMFDVIISTNMHEALEYIEQFLSVRYLLVFVFFVFGSVLFTRYSIKVSKCVSARKKAILVGVILAFTIADMSRLGLDKWWIVTCRDFSVARLINIIDVGYENIKEYEYYEGKASENTAVVNKDNSDIPYVIFILGESTSRNHMGLYGYDLDTTPLLNQRKSSGDLYVFSDVISHHSHTLMVMRELFTFYRRDMEDDWFRHNNIFDILRQTNYHTVWLSNQESSGVWSLDKFYSNRCDEKYFSALRESRDDNALLDETLLPVLKKINYSEKNFVVIHLMGTHGKYNKRYPKEFEIFKTDDESKGIDIKQKQIRSEYDNAVLYNDYIVDSIIEQFKNDDAIVIYVSDHADEVYEDRDFVGHSESHGTKFMIEIPMLIWTSHIFKEKRPQLTQRIADSVDRPFMTDDMIHVLMDILSIDTDDYDPKLSVINNNYKSSERFYNGMRYVKFNNETKMVNE